MTNKTITQVHRLQFLRKRMDQVEAALNETGDQLDVELSGPDLDRDGVKQFLKGLKFVIEQKDLMDRMKDEFIAVSEDIGYSIENEAEEAAS